MRVLVTLFTLSIVVLLIVEAKPGGWGWEEPPRPTTNWGWDNQDSSQRFYCQALGRIVSSVGECLRYPARRPYNDHNHGGYQKGGYPGGGYQEGGHRGGGYQEGGYREGGYHKGRYQGRRGKGHTHLHRDQDTQDYNWGW